MGVDRARETFYVTYHAISAKISWAAVVLPTGRPTGFLCLHEMSHRTRNEHPMWLCVGCPKETGENLSRKFPWHLP